MKNGRRTFTDRDVMAYIKSAKVPTRVAFSYSLSISSGVMWGFSCR